MLVENSSVSFLFQKKPTPTVTFTIRHCLVVDQMCVTRSGYERRTEC